MNKVICQGCTQASAPHAFSVAVRRMQDEFRARRDMLYESLNAIPGISVAVRPAGAIYLLANVSGTGLGSAEFSERLLVEHGVALLDAAHFGAGGQGLVRISFAQSRERLAEGCSRIAAFAASLRSE